MAGILLGCQLRKLASGPLTLLLVFVIDARVLALYIRLKFLHQAYRFLRHKNCHSLLIRRLFLIRLIQVE
jgi:hypothetical protein